MGLLAFVAPKDATPPNFMEKLLFIATKLQKSRKFSPSVYGMDRKEHPERNWKTLFNTKQNECATRTKH